MANFTPEDVLEATAFVTNKLVAEGVLPPGFAFESVLIEDVLYDAKTGEPIAQEEQCDCGLHKGNAAMERDDVPTEVDPAVAGLGLYERDAEAAATAFVNSINRDASDMLAQSIANQKYGSPYGQIPAGFDKLMAAESQRPTTLSEESADDFIAALEGALKGLQEEEEWELEHESYVFAYQQGTQPEWVARPVNPNKVERMTQLLTKDGRVTGNATIADIIWDRNTGSALFRVITDAGNITDYSASELGQRFHRPHVILVDFPMNHDGEMDALLEDYEDDHNGVNF